MLPRSMAPEEGIVAFTDAVNALTETVICANPVGSMRGAAAREGFLDEHAAPATVILHTACDPSQPSS